MVWTPATVISAIAAGGVLLAPVWTYAFGPPSPKGLLDRPGNKGYAIAWFKLICAIAFLMFMVVQIIQDFRLGYTITIFIGGMLVTASLAWIPVIRRSVNRVHTAAAVKKYARVLESSRDDAEHNRAHFSAMRTASDRELAFYQMKKDQVVDDLGRLDSWALGDSRYTQWLNEITKAIRYYESMIEQEHLARRRLDDMDTLHEHRLARGGIALNAIRENRPWPASEADHKNDA